MKKLIALTVLISAVTLAAFWASRKICLVCGVGSHGGKISYADLGLNAGQEKTLKGLELSYRKQADELCRKICALRLEVFRLMKNSKTDSGILDKKIEEIGGFQIRLEKETAAHILEVQKNLGPGQSDRYMTRIESQLCESIRQMNMMDAGKKSEVTMKMSD